MILPILAYGHPVLKKKSIEVLKDHSGLQKLIDDIYETMRKAQGVGLAAPQVGQNIRLFIADGAGFENNEEMKNFSQVFINPVLEEEFDKEWEYSEGCLSIPGIRENILRPFSIKITYYDRDWIKHSHEVFTNLKARIIQHEYDHINGILFTDRVNPLKKQLLKNKLKDIARGKVEVGYKMVFPVR